MKLQTVFDRFVQIVDNMTIGEFHDQYIQAVVDSSESHLMGVFDSVDQEVLYECKNSSTEIQTITQESRYQTHIFMNDHVTLSDQQNYDENDWGGMAA